GALRWSSCRRPGDVSVPQGQSLFYGVVRPAFARKPKWMTAALELSPDGGCRAQPTDLRWASDLAAHLDHAISARWGIARLGSTPPALGGLDIETGRGPARQARTAIRRLPERRDVRVACAGLTREPVPGQADQGAEAEQR